MTAKPTLVEKMALRACQARRAALRKQPLTDAVAMAHLPESEMLAARAALAVVLEEMREPSEGMWHAGALAGSQGRTRAIWGWQAMLAQFEKEQAGG